MAFKLLPNDVYLHILCPEEIDETELKQLTIQSKEWLSKDHKLLVFDFEEVINMSLDAYRVFAQIYKELKGSERVLCSINMSKELKSEIIRAGMSGVFSPR